MRVIMCVENGDPEKLILEERAPLSAGPGEALVSVRACGVNYVDTLFVRGLYQIKPELPFVPGSEIAGVVEALGEGVSGLEVGAHVVGMPGLNGFAEQVALPADRFIRVPEGLDLQRAAGFVQSYCTGLFALRERGKLQKGETMLVLGAAGGVGLAAIDIGKALGARVIAAASSEAKLAACRDQGADEVILYTEEDLKTRAKALSDGGVDVVYDPVGDVYSEPALRAIAPGGRHLVIGFAAGAIPEVRWNLILLKQCQVVGVDWGGWSARNREANAAQIEDLGKMIAAGTLRPLAPTTYRFEDAAIALRDLMERRVVGKAALLVE